MTLRRYAPMKPSRGTVIPPRLRLEVFERDQVCVGWLRFPDGCSGPLELDHVRASHGIGMKSETTAGNLVSLCGFHHRWKTANGRTARPILLAYLEEVADPHSRHVDVVSSCPACRAAVGSEK